MYIIEPTVRLSPAVLISSSEEQVAVYRHSVRIEDEKRFIPYFFENLIGNALNNQA
jgi:hypothetical protein